MPVTGRRRAHSSTSATGSPSATASCCCRPPLPLAYAAALGRAAFALHISPTSEEADRFLGYWQAWGDHLPLEVIVSPHRAVVAPLVNYIWTLHRQRPDLTLTVAVPELVDRHWWHRTLYEHIAERTATRSESAEPTRPVSPH